ncbi:MAG: FAD-dependent oxidoreductase [Armatimonadetes bacterium]|nr:FAD-dependent oxidoreductase [Armatimonadota bacterium]
MKVAVIGAGVSGLAAARTLHQGGAEVVVFEKSGKVGGRVATRKVGDFVFDTGASSIVPRGLALQSVLLNELPQDELHLIQKPIYIFENHHISVGDHARNSQPRYTYINGNATLPNLLVDGLDIRLNTSVETIEKADDGFAVLDTKFDRVVTATPIPQAAPLLWGIGETRPFANSSFRSCLSILLGFTKEFEQMPPFHALLDPEGRNPLGWLSIESVKSPNRAPNGCTAIVAQLNAPFSKTHFEDADDKIVEWTLDSMARVIGPGWAEPTVKEVKRWKYSQPEGLASFESVNKPGSKVVIAGDGLLGGRVEQAYQSGLRAAQILLVG